ncbi:hypothetical protein MuYL_0508 [Mucilaginibacter xinganensis]|uniref:Uncharacterized protein n=1 Tax=Mucilaginibacter xinganensis TaxID=1234841 RepID=A0A223NSC8_9SPHI|nr:hypothetical protein MuYL_0508 [Mucilaginibacter xinganensis]
MPTNIIILLWIALLWVNFPLNRLYSYPGGSVLFNKKILSGQERILN